MVIKKQNKKLIKNRTAPDRTSRKGKAPAGKTKAAAHGSPASPQALAAPPKLPTVRMVPLSQLKLSKHARIDEEHARALAESMRTVGLQHPVHADQRFNVLAGHHRVRAAQILGWKEMPVIVMSDGDIKAELWSLDENLMRRDLGLLERCRLLRRRKELYESLHPETRQGGGPGKPGGGKASIQGPGGFVSDTARKTGRGRSTVAEEAKIGGLPDAVCERLAGSAAANKKGPLLKLARLHGKAQLDEAGRLAATKPMKKTRQQPAAKDQPADHVDRAVRSIQAWLEADDGSLDADNRCLRAAVRLMSFAADLIDEVADGWEADSVAPETQAPLRDHASDLRDLAAQYERDLVIVSPCSCDRQPECEECGGAGGFTQADLDERQDAVPDGNEVENEEEADDTTDDTTKTG